METINAIIKNNEVVPGISRIKAITKYNRFEELKTKLASEINIIYQSQLLTDQLNTYIEVPDIKRIVKSKHERYLALVRFDYIELIEIKDNIIVNNTKISQSINEKDLLVFSSDETLLIYSKCSSKCVNGICCINVEELKSIKVDLDKIWYDDTEFYTLDDSRIYRPIQECIISKTTDEYHLILSDNKTNIYN